MSEQLTYYLEQNPAIAKIICEKAVLAKRARDAARKAREATRKTALSVAALRENLQTVQIRTLKTVKYL